jgi:protein SCO1/2
MNKALCCLLLTGVLWFSGCRPASAPRAADAAREYELRGKVVAVDVAKKRVTIDHEAMPGYMEAMTMPFAIRDDEMLGILAPGDTVTGKLLVEQNISWIVVQSVSKPSEPIPGATPYPQAKAGDEVPDVALVNQDGKKINLRQYRGQIVLLTFIYTRCPLPDFCILMSENFGQVSKVIAGNPALKGKVRLLSISIDPEYDQPATLKTYGQNYMSRFTRTDFNLWAFATGEPEAIRKFAGFWGLTYQKDGTQIAHSLRTAFIDAQGKIIQVFDDKWQPQEAVMVLEKAVGGGK